MNTFLLEPQQQPQGGEGNIIFMIVLYAAIFLALYFFLIRPNSKRKKQEAELRNNLEIGDEITTIGGIVGRVVAIKEEEDEIIIETGSDRCKLKMKRWCISSVNTVKEKSEAKTEEKTEKKGFFSKKSDNKNEK